MLFCLPIDKQDRVMHHMQSQVLSKCTAVQCNFTLVLNSTTPDKWERSNVIGTVLSVFFLISLHSQGIQESWPAHYTLSVLPPELQEALKRKDPNFKKKDKSHLRALLIQVLFDNITKYTWYCYTLDFYSSLWSGTYSTLRLLCWLL